MGRDESRAVTPQFRSPLIVEDDGGRFVLTAPLVYDSLVLQVALTVPAGFPTDFASIPRGLWNILPPVGKYDAAAMCHDWLYQTGMYHGVTVDRGDADRVLLEAMEVLGVARWQRWAIYLGVRIGGAGIWRGYREKVSV